jgi:hypothetical protein
MSYPGSERGGAPGKGPSTAGPLALGFVLLLLAVLEAFGLLPGVG